MAPDDDAPSPADPNRAGDQQVREELDAGPEGHTPAEPTPSSESSLPPGSKTKPE
jgi:hypothetical protein